MKSKILSFTITAPKTRAHRALFCEDTPFKPKIVKSKVKYKRHPKNQKEYLNE